MPDYSRKDFIADLFPSKLKKETNKPYNIQEDVIFNKYANKVSPLNIKRTRAGLSPYVGPWTFKQKIHLLRRMQYGVSPADINALGSMTMDQAVDAFINNTPPTPAPPVNYYEAIYADPTSIALGATWINAPYGDGTVNYYRRLSVKAWWMKNISLQNQSIQEKMLAFWSNFFVVESNVIDDARLQFKYMDLLRTHALGNFKTFFKEMTLEPAMLFYLNGHYNIKNSPDENYAREMQELFSVGKGANMWTEDDVKEAAKVLTGFRVDMNTLSTNFMPGQHETANKTFTTFYNNTVITGLSGAAGATELDALIDMIFAKDQFVAKHVCRRLYRFFIYYDIDPTIEATIIDGLAQTFISSNWDIKPVLAQLFKSDHFYDNLTMDCFITTPMDYFLGMKRSLNISINNSTIEDEYIGYYTLAYLCDNIGMDPGDPPSVSGWPAFYQIPHFHQMWINSDTLPKRMKFTDTLFTTNGIYYNGSPRLKCDVIAFVQTLSDPTNPIAIIDDCVSYLLAIGLSTSLKDSFKTLLLDGSMLNSSWTSAWTNYINNPGNATYEAIVRNRLQDMLTKLCRMAEHHLC